MGGGLQPRPPHTPVRSGPYTAVREVALTRLEQDGRPSELKCAFESPVERALLRARYQGPRPLPAVFLAVHGETPCATSAARRRRGVFHWRQRAARSRSRTQRVRAINTSGVSQKPK